MYIITIEKTIYIVLSEMDELVDSLWQKVVIYLNDNRINTNVQKWQYSPSTLPWLCIILYINPNNPNPNPNPNMKNPTHYVLHV